MVSCGTVWLVLLSGVAICGAFDSLFPLDVGLYEEDTLMPIERDSFDDCHLRNARYGREEIKPQNPPPPYEVDREYSHVAAIGWTRSGGTVDWACMGTLIWDKYVLTSAHCTMDERNTEPDVVRMGEASPAHIQEVQIGHILRHPEFDPETGINDIALLELAKRITINETVVPACLWLAPNTVFPKLESLARAKGDLAQISSVESAQTTGSKCSPGGGKLQDSQMCVEPLASEATKCFDAPAGNPLQVRLLHNFKTSPFLVGIMSGGRKSASCKPTGVFTRIGNYMEWILQQLEQRNSTAKPGHFVPLVCALRYVHLQPRVDQLIMERFDEISTVSANAEWKHERDFTYIPRIVWPAAAGQDARNDCAGTFVDPSTVLTLAECVARTPGGHGPTAVIHLSRYRNTSVPIRSVTVHPQYVQGSQANNIAVIKLEKPDDVVPGCIWQFDAPLHTRVDLAGIGASVLIPNSDNIQDQPESSIPIHHLRAVDHLPWPNCTDELTRMNTPLRGVNGEQHVCYRNEQWIVPGACDWLPGAPVQRYVGRSWLFMKYVYALSLAGPTCGYGLPAVALTLQPHIPWLRSVMMEDSSGAQSRPGSASPSESDSVIVINPDLQRSDECSNGDGTLGICVPHEMCLSTPERLRKGERVTLCSVGSVVCCPWGDIARNAASNPVRTELANCEARWRTLREQRYQARTPTDSNYDNFPHLAEIGWPQDGGRLQYQCMGYLITTNTVLTSARCAESQRWKPTVARIGSLNAVDSSSYVVQPIRRVTVHEEYDDVTGVNNLALIQLTAHITPTALYFPGCLFHNATHVPLRQFGVMYSRSSPTVGRIFPMYGRDCRELQPGKSLARGLVCYQRYRPESVFQFSRTCFEPGDLMVWPRESDEEIDSTEYLVAIYNHGVCAEEDDLLTATSISAYYDWIADNIK